MKKIESFGRTRGLHLVASPVEVDPLDTTGSEDFYLYPAHHTPKELIEELELMIEFIKRNIDAEFYVDKAE